MVLKNSGPPLRVNRVRTSVKIQGHFFLGVLFFYILASALAVLLCELLDLFPLQALCCL